jgi:hypothetical protein
MTRVNYEDENYYCPYCGSRMYLDDVADDIWKCTNPECIMEGFQHTDSDGNCYLDVDEEELLERDYEESEEDYQNLYDEYVLNENRRKWEESLNK